jgi:hypothetical protein
MGLFTQNMKPCIFFNESQNISNHIMGCNPFLTMVATKKVCLYFKGTFSVKFEIYLGQMIICKGIR